MFKNFYCKFKFLFFYIVVLRHVVSFFIEFTCLDKIIDEFQAYMVTRDEHLQSIVERIGVKKWTEVSNELSNIRGQKPRSGKQCRERWHNHLNPQIANKDWSEQQQERLFILHERFGNRWTVIAQHLHGRTDNSIKNYFYSTIRRSLRRMGKFVGSKNSTQTMKKIKPSILAKIFAAQSQIQLTSDLPHEELQLRKFVRESCAHVRQQIVRFINFKPLKQQKAGEREGKNFQETISKLQHINRVYEKIKHSQFRRKNQEMMFQGNYNKIDEESQESQMSEESHAMATPHYKKTSKIETRSHTKQVTPKTQHELYKINISHSSQTKKQQIQQKQKINSGLLVPIIVADQLNSPQEGSYNQGSHLNPSFDIELKDQFPIFNIEKHSTNSFTPGLTPGLTPGPSQGMNSPSFMFGTPAINQLNFFQSPASPMKVDYLSSLHNLGSISSNVFDDFQIFLQRQIEGNINGQERKTANSHNTIGSPGSAFRFYGF